MRMPPDHLVMNLPDHIRHAKAPLLLRDLRMKNNLQQQVPHLLREFLVISRVESLQHFVSFFEQIRSQRLVRLFAVPGTPFRRP